ncbi:MAG: hypothetical protein UX17_C0068G0008 [Parcubacteria group bacterium GW2011_GWC2_45_7]|nr:MAG: hypothetical protein UX17_C0068G0008 [Parcubacteria group bacterium GW2011_GWC2_45_7]
MDLENFIKETLVAIKKGVVGANKEFETSVRNSFLMYSKSADESMINFDVALTVSSEGGVSGGAGIKVAGVNIGGEKNNKNSQEAVSRIKFCVQVGNMTS